MAPPPSTSWGPPPGPPQNAPPAEEPQPPPKKSKFGGKLGNTVRLSSIFMCVYKPLTVINYFIFPFGLSQLAQAAVGGVGFGAGQSLSLRFNASYLTNLLGSAVGSGIINSIF